MSLAVISLLILLLCIVLFVLEPIPTSVTAVLGCVLMVLTGACTFAEAFNGFSSETIILFGSMLIVGQTLMETGLARIVGLKIVEIAKGNERVLLFLCCVSSFVMSMFLANTAVIAMFLALMAGVCSSAKDINIRNLMLPIAISAVIGGISTIVGSTQQLVAQGVMQDTYGRGFDFFEFLRITAPIFIVALGFFMTIGYKSGNKIWGDRPVPKIVSPGPIDGESEFEYDKKKVIMSAVIFIGAIVAFLMQISSNAIIACSAALLCLGTKCITIKAAQEKPSWPIVIWLAGCLGLAKGLTEAGAADLIAEVLVSLCGGMDVFLLFALICLATMALSTFMSSTTAMLVFLMAALPLCNALGYNAWAFSIGIIMSASVVFLTPLANGHVGMVLVSGYKFSDYVRVYWPLAIAVYVLIVIVTPLWYPLVV